MSTSPGNGTLVAPAVAVLAALVLGSCGSGSSTTTPPTTTTDTVAVATAVGTPTGTAASGVIGPAGGSLPSADGRVTVVVPPGAVATNTTFTIQPITNEAPGGMGDGYRLGPSGQTFNSPVQLTVHLTDNDLAGTTSDALGIAYQDAQGYWNEPLGVSYDPTGKTLTAPTTHFSDWVTINEFQLSPAQAAIAVSTSVGLTATYCRGVPQNGIAARLARCYSDGLSAGQWAVNGSPGGTSTVGTVAGGGTSATYSAPAHQPSPNTVAVSAKITDFLMRTGAQGTVQVVSNIIVYEESWTATINAEGSGLGTSALVKWVLDSRVNNVATYRPTGTITMQIYGCTISPATHALEPSEDGILVVDYNPIPPTYHGSGTSAWTASLSCGGGPPFLSTVAAAYFGGSAGQNGAEAVGIVGTTAGETSIQGHSTASGISFDWIMTRDH